MDDVRVSEAREQLKAIERKLATDLDEFYRKTGLVIEGVRVNSVNVGTTFATSFIFQVSIDARL